MELHNRVFKLKNNYHLRKIRSYLLTSVITILVGCGGSVDNLSNNVSNSSIDPNQLTYNNPVLYELLGSSNSTWPGSGVGTTMSPDDLRAHYNIPSYYTGAGQNIVIVDNLGSITASQISADLNTFSTYYGLPLMPICTGNNAPCLTIVDNSSGGSSIPAVIPNRSNDGWTIETALDLQWAHAIAPKASLTLIISNGDLMGVNGVQAAINQPNVNSISMSFTVSNISSPNSDASSLHDTYDAIFHNAITAKGIAFFAATGDYGNKIYNSAMYPASSPWVTAVGGTNIINTSLVSSANESAWGTFSNGVLQTGTGGGYTQYITIPDFQSNYFALSGSIVPSLLNANSGKRSTPDVSINGGDKSSVGVVVGGAWYATSGTSESTPIWAGISALIGEALAKKGSSLAVAIKAAGSFNNLLYSKATYTTLSPTFVDVNIAGSNNNNTPSTNCTVICATQVGYDDLTGIGVPNVANLIASF
jgi:subtilase family serine protease